MNKDYIKNWVDVRSDRAGEALVWAKAHCSNYITNEVVFDQYSPLIPKDGGWVRPYFYRFYFGDLKQQTMFALRWV